MDDRPDCAAQSKATLRLKFGNASGISGESSGQISISRPSDSQRNSLAHPLKGFKKGILQHLLFRVELFIARRTIVDLYHRLIQSYRGKASTTASAGGGEIGGNAWKFVVLYKGITLRRVLYFTYIRPPTILTGV